MQELITQVRAVVWKKTKDESTGIILQRLVKVQKQRIAANVRGEHYRNFPLFARENGVNSKLRVCCSSKSKPSLDLNSVSF